VKFMAGKYDTGYIEKVINEGHFQSVEKK